MKSQGLHTAGLILLAVAALTASCKGKPAAPTPSAGAPATAPGPPGAAAQPDGFPSGHGSPEGVACDLARSFINRDTPLFLDASIRPFGGEQSKADYDAFLKETSASIESESRRSTAPPRGPKQIVKVFAARHLSRSGPASYGSATYRFQDVMFVDVLVLLHSGKGYENRTLVIQGPDGKWYAHPFPDAYPLLSTGLNDEDESTVEFQP